MSGRCCGHMRTGKYCNNCGEQLCPSPLGELLVHCRSIARTEKTRLGQVAQALAEAEQEGDTSDRSKLLHTASAQHAARLRKWQARADALANMLKVDPAAGQD